MIIDLYTDLGEIVSNLAGNSGWPKESDKKDTIEAILRLHHIYNFNLSEVRALFQILLHFNAPFNN